MSQRYFIGLPLPAPVSDVVLRAAASLRAADARWADAKWVRPENLHVTLAFLGDVEDETLRLLVPALEEVSRASAPPSLRLDGVAARPGPGRCRMIWAVFSDLDGRAADLASVVAQTTRSFGLADTERPFVPHVTLCRARRPLRISPALIDDLTRLVCEADASVSDPPVTLYSSRLTPRGPQYHVVARFRTGG